VYVRQKSGRIHYHLLVNVGADIRTGFSFSAAAKGDYRSASPALRSEWAFWRRTAKLYRFGRTELLPIMSSSVAVARYVGKYISKHFDSREARDSGVRLVSYVGPRVASVKFMWAGGGAKAWRAGLGALVRDLAASGQIDFPSFDAMRRAYGRRWAWEWRDVISARALDCKVDKQTGEIYGADLSSSASLRTDPSVGGVLEAGTCPQPQRRRNAKPRENREDLLRAQKVRRGSDSFLATSTCADSATVVGGEVLSFEMRGSITPPVKTGLSSRG
jgi:hypothetical protein